MAAGKRYFVISLLIFFLISVCCLPEPGKKDLHFKKNQTFDMFTKTMNKGYSIAIKGNCSGVETINIHWRLYVSQCAEFFSFQKMEQSLWTSTDEQIINYSLTGKQDGVKCSARIHLQDVTDLVKERIISTPTEESTSSDGNPAKKSQDILSKPQTSKESKNVEDQATKKGRRRRAEQNGDNDNTVDKDDEDATADSEVKALLSEASKTEKPEEKTISDTENESDAQEKKEKKTEHASKTEKPEEKTTSDTENESDSAPDKKKKKTEHVKNQVCATQRDGVFVLIVKAEPDGSEKDKKFDLTLNVEMKGQHGYLSASDWPLYPFYGCMSLLYVFYGIVWLIVSACQWRDLLRIQFWIGGVIALGMLEKAVFFSEYNNVNITGETNPGLTVFAELVSCVKRTLARILVIIVSMGFGIVKPRLGTTLHRVLGVGALYFILATIEGCFRSLHPKSDPGKQQLIASIPLAVLDASICWWIFMSLVQTTRTLRIRRNLVKLSLYRHFTNTLVFAVLASVAYMIWSIKTHRFAKNGCITDWSELWLDEAFWHFLFSIVLLVIMVLWRPTANNQRYAFTPIVDFGDDDDDENMTLSDAFDGMKMRNVKNTPEVIINGDTKRKHKPEDDLKWVEENIPSSAADAVLPSVLDSDEELMTTKFEMSKME